jgi:hypothetical protein
VKTITLQIDDTISERFYWLLRHFGESELKIIEMGEYASEDDYLRSIPGMVESLKAERREPLAAGKLQSELACWSDYE